MTTARIRHLPFIENNELKGIVSIGDLVKHRLDEKELEASVLPGDQFGVLSRLLRRRVV
jgi:CBS domain-containing protein